MTDLFEPVDTTDARLALGATGLLAHFNAAGVLTSADVHVAAALGRLGRETDEQVLLAVALVVAQRIEMYIRARRILAGGPDAHVVAQAGG